MHRAATFSSLAVGVGRGGLHSSHTPGTVGEESMSIFKYEGGNIYYAGFGVGGQYFVRSLGTSNRREAEREEKKLRALAEAGRLPLKVSADDRTKKIKKSLANRTVSRVHRASLKAAVKERKDDPKKHADWIAAIKTGQADPEVVKVMKKANRDSADNPVSQSRRRRSGKRAWKIRGRKQRVSRSMTNKWATDKDFRKKNLEGRDRAAADRLKRHGFLIRSGAPKPLRKRGPIPRPTENSWFKIGSKIHDKIPISMRSDTKAATIARKAYSVETGGRVSVEMCGSYHRRYVRWLKANPSVGPSEIPSQ
jgi:hypothetical protein